MANYRKSFLYYTDQTWALEGPTGFYAGDISGLGKVAMGICELNKRLRVFTNIQESSLSN